MSIHIEGPFGGCDEQAETVAFELACGGVSEAQRLFRLALNLDYGSNLDVVAKREGFTSEAVSALKHLR